jgi:hypothetical protein
MKEILVSILAKIASGRYILTVICGVVFAFAVWKRILPDAATASIITSVFTAYFGRTDRNTKGGVV